jgi:YegS/Rv2252/BmrU family lipid kinase
MTKKAAIIVNPVAGTKKAKKGVLEIIGSLGRQDYETTVYVTRRRGDAAKAAKYYGKTYDAIVCCGGDGTLNEVLHGLLHVEEKPLLLYYPCGSTNDFAKTLGLPTDAKKVAENIEGRKVMELDVGRLNGKKLFSYIASFGAFVRASYAAPRAVKNVVGHFAYILEGAKEIPNLGKSYHTKITYDDGVIEGDFALVGVTNSTSAGGVIRLPEGDVSLCDGVFEIFLIKGVDAVADVAKTVPMLLKKEYDGDKVRLLHTTKAVIECEEGPDWCTDGEYAGKITRAELECLKGAVRILI